MFWTCKSTEFLCIAIFLVAAQDSFAETSQTISATMQPDGVHVTVQGKTFTVYQTRNTQKYPYFFPVNGPLSGKSVTTESSEPYPHHHSLFFGCDHVNGGNYWQEGLDRGQILSRSVDIVEPEGTSVVFTNECEWRRRSAASPFRDQRKIVISAPSPDVRYIDLDITLIALTDVRITKTNHSLFSTRMVPELSVRNGGTLINARGDSAEKGTFGRKASWCDYWGERDGVREGLAILVHPSNRWYPPRWFTRDYGFFSPTPMYWLDEIGLRFRAGDQLTLRYRVVVHAGSSREARIADLFEEWSNTAP